MATEFTVRLEDRPGRLAELGAALGDAGVNIDAIQGMTCEGQGVIQLVPSDAEDTTEVLKAAKIAFTTREVLVVNIMDEPGTLGDVALVMSEAGINIDAVYATLSGKIVLGVDDVAGALQVAGGMAVLQVT
jgi:hypothetical protein